MAATMTFPTDSAYPAGWLRRTLAAALRPGPLARRLALRVILFSAALALLITATELGFEYRRDLHRIDDRMAQIRVAYLDSVTENVWVADRERIETLLQGISRLPDFVQAEVLVNGRTEYRFGPGLQGAEGVSEVFELWRTHQGRRLLIGELVVAATYEGAWRRLLERAAFFLVGNAAKTLLVVLFIFGLYYRLIGRHLERTAAYAQAHAHADAAEPLQLERQPRRDELDDLVTALNHMRGELVQRSQAQQAQLERLAEQAALLDLAYDAILVRDLEGRILYWNHGAQATYGWSAAQALGRTAHHLLQTHTPESLLHIEDTLLRTGRWEGELGHTTQAGARIVVASRWALKRDASGAPVAVLEINRDVTERRQIAQQVEHLAHHDPLTRLPNRLQLAGRLDQALEAARRIGGVVAVLLVDLDHFKKINDSLGHDAGDELLVQVAQRLKSCVRDSDVVARLGSDEFVVVLTSLRDATVVAPTARKMLEVLAQPCQLGPHTVQCDCTIGVALSPQDGQDRQTLLRNADTAMFLGKSQGRGAVRFYGEQGATSSARA